jgi:hypothetical protein
MVYIGIGDKITVAAGAPNMTPPEQVAVNV